MRTLPECERQRIGESTVDHGVRVLLFLFRENCTATLSDQDLDHAEVAAKYGATARGILPLAVDRISDLRHLIALVLRDRQRAVPQAAQIAVTEPEQPNIGPMAWLPDRPIVRPPAPSYAKPVPVEIQF